MREAVTVSDATTGRILLWNPAAERLFGYTAEEARALPVGALLPETKREEILSELATYLATGHSRLTDSDGALEYPILRKDGAEITIEATVSPVEPPTESPTPSRYLLGISRDVTERKRAEQARLLRARHAALRGDVAAALATGGGLPEMLQRCCEGIVQHLDAAFARIWTLSDREQVLELRASAGLYTHIDGGHARVPVGMFKIGLIAQERLPHLTNDVQHDPRVGDRDWARREGMVAFAGYPLLVEDRLVGVMAMFARQPLADETLDALGGIADAIAQGIERRRAEDALRAASVAQELMLASARAVLWRCDARTFHFSYISPEAEKILGYPLERWTTEPTFWADHVYAEDREWAVGYCLQSTNALQNHEFEYRMVAADGRIVWLRDLVAVVAEHGKPKELIGVMVDITRDKEIQDELQRRAEELQRSNRDLEQFAYVASHDLQEPLRTVVSYLQLLEEDYRDALGPTGKEFLDYAVDGARRMQSLIDDLLAYSRIGSRGKAPSAVDAEVTLRAVQEDLHSLIEAVGATITHDPLPVVRADEIQLGQLLQNLVSNALKFRGTEPPRIHVSAQPEGPFWRFAVRDNGIGIAPQYHDQIFVIFQRLHVRDEYPGTGIGLAVCKRIVERHGGRLWVESTPGHGSTFHFTLPAAEGVK